MIQSRWDCGQAIFTAAAAPVLSNRNPKVALALQHHPDVLATEGRLAESEPLTREALALQYRLGLKGWTNCCKPFRLGSFIGAIPRVARRTRNPGLDASDPFGMDVNVQTPGLRRLS